MKTLFLLILLLLILLILLLYSATLGALDPRYEVSEGRRTPAYYRAEVEAGRDLIRAFLQAEGGAAGGGLSEINTSYCYVPVSDRPEDSSGGSSYSSSSSSSGSSSQRAQWLPTLAEMPVAEHGKPSLCSVHSTLIALSIEYMYMYM
jgi:hypothetical protein